jgi:hypothetical protein
LLFRANPKKYIESDSAHFVYKTYLAHSTEPEQCLLYTTTTSSSLSSPEHKKEAIKARDPDPLNYLVEFQKK